MNILDWLKKFFNIKKPAQIKQTETKTYEDGRDHIRGLSVSAAIFDEVEDEGDWMEGVPTCLPKPMSKELKNRKRKSQQRNWKKWKKRHKRIK